MDYRAVRHSKKSIGLSASLGRKRQQIHRTITSRAARATALVRDSALELDFYKLFAISLHIALRTPDKLPL